MYYCGKRIGTKNHVYGPEIRSHFLIALVEKGTAVLYRNEKEFLFKERDILVMFPGERIFYKAQTDWTIQWIGVGGNQVENIFQTIGVTREKPIFTPEKYEEISITIGFNDPLYFSKIFYKTEGITPSEYRKMHNKQI